MTDQNGFQTAPPSVLEPQSSPEGGKLSGEAIRAEEKRLRRNAYMREWSSRHKEQIRARTKKWKKENPRRRSELGKAYDKRHPEVVRRKSAKYRASHREVVNAKTREYHAKNKEKTNARHREWCRANPEVVREHDRRKRARKRGNGGRVPAGTISKMLVTQGGKCAYCLSRFIEKKYHVDHIIPLARGGEHSPGNIQLLCPRCNQKKHAKPPEIAMVEAGLLPLV